MPGGDGLPAHAQVPPDVRVGKHPVKRLVQAAVVRAGTMSEPPAATSWTASASLATTASPAAMASRTGIPKPSTSDG